MSNGILKEKPRRLWVIIKWKPGSALRVTRSRAQGDLLGYRFSWEKAVQQRPCLRARWRERASSACQVLATVTGLVEMMTLRTDRSPSDRLFKQWTKERNFPRKLILGKERPSQQGTCLSEAWSAAPGANAGSVVGETDCAILAWLLKLCSHFRTSEGFAESLSPPQWGHTE